MNRTILIALAMLGVGCKESEDSSTTKEQDPLTTVVSLKGGGFITYKIVLIDGVKHYASRTKDGNYVIGPRKE